MNHVRTTNKLIIAQPFLIAYQNKKFSLFFAFQSKLSNVTVAKRIRIFDRSSSPYIFSRHPEYRSIYVQYYDDLVES